MIVDTDETSAWTIKRLINWTQEYLANAEVESARLCAEILLGHVLGCPRIDLYIRFDYCPTAEQLDKFRELVRRCGKHEPVAYLTGKAHFWGLEFIVTPDVLIPRPETEVLVTQAVKFIHQQTNRPKVDVLDLCTGSGCVAVAIGTEAVEAEVSATDSRSAALQIAQKNIEAHDLQGRVKLLESDLFENLDGSDKGVFDLIVSNPPYISEKEFAELAPVVRGYEPKQALLAGVDGLDYYRRILEQAENYLADGGAIMLEIAFNQAEKVISLFEKSGSLEEIAAVKDHLGHNRVIKAQKK